jgi:hypothetical protein
MHLLSFITALKQDDTQEIITHLIADFDKVLTLSKKVNILIDNICSLSPKTLEIVLPMFNITYDYGTPDALYVKAVGCSPRTFGFINAYYNPDKKIRLKAYTRGVMTNQLENIKKIRGVSASKLEAIREGNKKNPNVSDSVKQYVNLDYKTARSKKDKSPVDDLIKKQKSSISRLVKSERMKAQFA